MQNHRRRTLILSTAAILFVIVGAVIAWQVGQSSSGEVFTPRGLTEYMNASVDQPDGDRETDYFPVYINSPTGPPMMRMEDDTGAIATVTCTVCHSIRDPNPDNRSATDLDEFHQNMRYAHGTLSCLSCHNRDDYSTLRLADQQVLGYRDVMTLCSQCHGQQAQSYAHGAHGGMNGYWDLTRGPRTRNGCIDCHDPHAPKFPSMIPTFKPRDRFLLPENAKGDNQHG